MANSETQRPLGIPIQEFLASMRKRGIVKDRTTQSPRVISRHSHEHLWDTLTELVSVSRKSNEGVWRALKWIELLNDTRRVLEVATTDHHTTISRAVFGYKPQNHYLDIVFIDTTLKVPITPLTLSESRINVSVFPGEQAQQLTDPEVLAQMNGGKKRQYIGTMTALSVASVARR